MQMLLCWKAQVWVLPLLCEERKREQKVLGGGAAACSRLPIPSPHPGCPKVSWEMGTLREARAWAPLHSPQHLCQARNLGQRTVYCVEQSPLKGQPQGPQSHQGCVWPLPVHYPSWARTTGVGAPVCAHGQRSCSHMQRHVHRPARGHCGWGATVFLQRWGLVGRGVESGRRRRSIPGGSSGRRMLLKN